jgi:hypothetical protein
MSPLFARAGYVSANMCSMPAKEECGDLIQEGVICRAHPSALPAQRGEEYSARAAQRGGGQFGARAALRDPSLFSEQAVQLETLILHLERWVRVSSEQAAQKRQAPLSLPVHLRQFRYPCLFSFCRFFPLSSLPYSLLSLARALTRSSCHYLLSFLPGLHRATSCRICRQRSE